MGEDENKKRERRHQEDLERLRGFRPIDDTFMRGVNIMKNYKIAVAGTGYVGLSIATLLSQHHKVRSEENTFVCSNSYGYNKIAPSHCCGHRSRKSRDDQ